ncbi:MAG: hypothetical protein U9N59_02480 [Campylobacterota bacterium]|nr:hypothetical protein [Campylobacterota bacterium]
MSKLMKLSHSKIVAGLLLATFSCSSIHAKMYCEEDEANYKYCKELKKYHHVKKNDMENIMFMTDSLQYLSNANTRNKLNRALSEKIFLVMKDINKTIKIAANEVRKEKYKALGMVVVPVKYGSNQKLKYQKLRDMARGKLKKQIKKFYDQYGDHDDEFLTDLLIANGSTFVILPEIIQYDEMKKNLLQDKETDFEIAVDGFFGLEKGMSESVITLSLKIDRNGNVRRVFDRKAEYEKVRKAIVDLIDNALGDIASQDE